MRKYYVFHLRRSSYEAYDGKESSLFLSLQKLRETKGYAEGLSLYNQICDPFDVSQLQEYFSKKYHVEKKKRYYFVDHKYDQTYLLELNYSCLVLLTKENLPNVFLNLSFYSPYLFVCDFENKDYFFFYYITSRTRKYAYNQV